MIVKKHKSYEPIPYSIDNDELKKLISRDDELIYRQYDSESDESDDDMGREAYKQLNLV